MDDIAVIIPLFNGERWIKRTLESVLAQTRPASEIALVDDGSSDDSRSLVSSFPSVRLVSNTTKGSGHARNHGLFLTSAPLVAFLDQDDVWHPRHLELLGRQLDQTPSVVAVASLGSSIGDDEEPWFDPQPTEDAQELDLWSAFPFGLIRCPGLVLARRWAIESLGGWNTSAVYVSDIDLWLKMSKLGTFMQMDAVTMGVRVHSDSYSGSLRSQKVDRYLTALRDLAHRLASESSEAVIARDVFQKRLRLADTLAELAGAYVANDPDAFVVGIRKLAGAIEEESPTFRTQTLHTLLWFFCPPGVSQGKWKMLSGLYGAWPRERAERRIIWQAVQDWPWSHWLVECMTRPFDESRLIQLYRSTKKLLLQPYRSLPCFGVDADGWARETWFARLDATNADHEMRMVLELPKWLGLRRQVLQIQMPNGRTMTKTLKPGRHVFRFVSPEVKIEAQELARLPGEQRERSIRVLSTTAVPRRSFRQKRAA